MDSDLAPAVSPIGEALPTRWRRFPPDLAVTRQYENISIKRYPRGAHLPVACRGAPRGYPRSMLSNSLYVLLQDVSGADRS